MKHKLLIYCTLIFFILLNTIELELSAQEPVAPNSSYEAKALLKYIYSLNSRYTLSGQHNFPLSGEKNTLFAADYIGKTPVVWSQDFGFAAESDKDSYLARSANVQEAIRQHKKGAIVTFCWHAVPPTAEEPVTFQPLPGRDTSSPLASVQGRLSDKQFRDILTPGTELYKQWVKQVDNIAFFLKQLQDAKVPVLWRPYHEMNGDWFWWGGRYEGKYTTAALYRQLFDRMTKVHKLNNLIWVWSVDRPVKDGREFIRYYPGNKYLDILAIDIYGNDFNQSYYEGLIKLSEGKPVTLGEVGNPPAVEILEKQPGWVYWVVWSGMVRGTSVADYERHTNNSRSLFLEDPVYLSGITEYRKSCELEPVKLNKAASFTGTWRLNECESTSSKDIAAGGFPYKLIVEQETGEIRLKSLTVTEWGEDDVTEQALSLDGSENISSAFMNSERRQIARWSAEKDSLTITSAITVKFGNNKSELKSKEVWTSEKRGKKLVIQQNADGFMGRAPTTSRLVYIRE